MTIEREKPKIRFKGTIHQLRYQTFATALINGSN